MLNGLLRNGETGENRDNHYRLTIMNPQLTIVRHQAWQWCPPNCFLPGRPMDLPLNDRQFEGFQNPSWSPCCRLQVLHIGFHESQVEEAKLLLGGCPIRQDSSNNDMDTSLTPATKHGIHQHNPSVESKGSPLPAPPQTLPGTNLHQVPSDYTT